MKWTHQIPNSLTLINLLMGTLGVIAMANALVMTALIMMGISLVADVFDGMLARKLGVSEGIGVQLDSLADIVSFGVLPAMMIFFLGSRYGGEFPGQQAIGVLAGLTAASAGLRLARFNIDTRSKKYFWGLATPAGAMLVAGWLWSQEVGRDFGFGVADLPFLIILVPVFIGVAYHVPLRLPGLKSPKAGITIAILLAISVVIGLFTIGPISIPAGIIFYFFIGILNVFLKWY